MPAKGECPGLERSPKLASSRPGGQPLPTHILTRPRLQVAGRTVFGPPPKPSSFSWSFFVQPLKEEGAELGHARPGLEGRG